MVRKKIDTRKCQCGRDASLVPSAMTSSWTARTRTTVTGVPENLGVSSVDHNPSRLIGAESHRAWGELKLRAEHKQKILRDNPGVQGKDLSRVQNSDSCDSGYRIMKSDESKNKETLREYGFKNLPHPSGN